MKSTPKGRTTKTTLLRAVSTDAALPVVDDVRRQALAEAVEAFHVSAAAARIKYPRRDHRKLFEDDPDRIDRLIAALAAGNYRSTAARTVGVSERVVREWLERADAGELRYEALAEVLLVAEAVAESEAVEDVRAAGKSPQFWAAAMTFLERRHRDKWGRGPEGASAQQSIIVHVGGCGREDVQIGISGPAPSAPGLQPAVIDAE